MPLNIDKRSVALAIPPLLRLAFRPLFLGGTLFSIIAISWWVYFWLNPFNWSPHGGPVWWHGHEMLFGFGAAIVVGFLLTAVQTWTGVIGVRGKPLAVLALSWLFGRLLLAFGVDLPGSIIAIGDVTFLLLAVIAMAYPVIKARQWRNLMFVPLLLVLALLNAASHWAVITEQAQLATQALHGTIMVFALIISIVGGRVIAAFTANTTGCQRARPIQWLDTVSITSIILMLIMAFFGFANVSSVLLLIISVIAALANGGRFLRWGIQHSGSDPLLWSLHLAYAFIPVGFLLIALHSIGLMDNLSAALHGITVGAIGGMILAMISRVTLGHTGRGLTPPHLISLAFICILLAAVVRIVLPAWLPQLNSWGIGIAGVLWVLAYGIYFYYYAPMLVSARVDGGLG
ncbi:MAG: NnrS family protein [Gammaproteobacteria bacterium]|nr:NnrS family protein [Gammaproteobacteria bacterium]